MKVTTFYERERLVLEMNKLEVNFDFWWHNVVIYT